MTRRLGVLFAYLLLVTQVISGLLFTPYVIRSLGQAEYGLYSLVTAITAYFMLLDAGVGNALVRYMAKFRVSGDTDRQNGFLGLSVAFYGGVGLVVLLLGLLLQGNLTLVFGGGLTRPELRQASTMLNITLLNAAVVLVVSAFDRTIIAYERFVFSKSMAILQLVARVSVLTVLLSLGYRALAVVSVSLVLSTAFGVVSILYVLLRLRVRPNVRGVQFGFIKEVVGYSGFILVQMVATQLNYMSNQVLLGVMTSSVAIGVYAVGAQLVQYLHSIAGGVNGVLMPGVVRMVEDGATPETLCEEMIKVGRLVLMVLGPIVVTFALSGQAFVTLWAGAANAPAYWVALLMMAPLTLSLSQSIGTQILWAKGEHKTQAVLQICVALLNILLTVVLIRTWKPAEGAALATALAYLVGDVVVLNVIFARDIGVSMRRYYTGLLRGIVPSLVVSGMVGALVGMLVSSGWVGFLAQASTMVLVYLVAMMVVGLNGYERNLLLTLLCKTRVQG